MRSATPPSSPRRKRGSGMKNKLSWLAGPYVLWMTLVVIVPILLVVVYAFTASGETAADIGGFTLDNFSRMGTYTVIFARSFQLALVATLVCLLIGYPLAYVLAKEGPGFQRVAMVIIMLPAGELGDPALFKALQVDHLEHLHDPVVDLLLGQLDLLFGLRVHLGDAQTEGDILKHVEVGEQGVPLKHSIYRPFVGRNRVNPHAVKKNIPGGGLLKTAYNTKRGGFAAPTGTQQREEFLVVDR